MAVNAATTTPAPATAQVASVAPESNTGNTTRRFRLPSLGPLTGDERPITQAEIQRLELNHEPTNMELFILSIFMAVAVLDAVFGIGLAVIATNFTRTDTTIILEPSQIVFIAFTTILLLISAIGVFWILYLRVWHPLSIFVEARAILGINVGVTFGIVIEILMAYFVPRSPHPVTEHILDPNETVRGCVCFHIFLFIVFVICEMSLCNYRIRRIEKAVRKQAARDQTELEVQGRNENGAEEVAGNGERVDNGVEASVV